MSNRCSPRSSTSAVSVKGSALASSAPFFPVKNAASACSDPRGTVPSTSGRALEPSLKNTLSRNGIAFGELCMSWRQPAAASRQNTDDSRQNLRLNFRYLAGVETAEELRRVRTVELRVLRLDEQEEAIAARALEPIDVE